MALLSNYPVQSAQQWKCFSYRQNIKHEMTRLNTWNMFKGLQPAIVQLLLENCNSIKVKRLFLYFVNRFRRGFVSKLDLTKINWGSGKRVIGSNGRYRYHPKYMLSLPEKIDEPDEYEYN